MTVETSTWLSSLAALTASSGGLPPLRPELAERARDLEKALAGVPPEAFYRAVAAEARTRLDRFAEGVRKYRAAKRVPRPAEPPVIWREGSSRLLDYGAVPETATAEGQQAPVVLVVPSLVNRYWVLDLDHDQSLLRSLAARGLRPLVVDWDAPRGEETAYTFTDYIAGRLSRALDFACDLNGGPVALVGYCMGGLLSLALAQLRLKDVRALVMMAAPWDFHVAYGDLVRVLDGMMPRLEDTVARAGVLPVDMMQTMFAGLDPYMTPEKFRRFAAMAPDTLEARRFVQLEDWLNDGVVLPGPVALECFRDWHLKNTPPRGEWIVAGDPILPAKVTCPALVVVPEKDHIVPPASSRALAAALPHAETLSVVAGHIGLVSGGRSRKALFAPLAGWLLAHAEPES
ncbi:MAG: poly-beta-hydroxybutyrate polymerase [Rhodospirillales bacterium CG15_BIG_FIL_POST_REV_8_21_14_020_66_15]|nr:MAG: poly-beta-hydroxybutyrate polymerase [Rhodospirillales bacterium CG15_BIG_FIL_POST_REV_8_21_14_020_66_15]